MDYFKFLEFMKGRGTGPKWQDMANYVSGLEAKYEKARRGDWPELSTAQFAVSAAEGVVSATRNLADERNALEAERDTLQKKVEELEASRGGYALYQSIVKERNEVEARLTGEIETLKATVATRESAIKAAMEDQEIYSNLVKSRDNRIKELEQQLKEQVGPKEVSDLTRQITNLQQMLENQSARYLGQEERLRLAREKLARSEQSYVDLINDLIGAVENAKAQL